MTTSALRCQPLRPAAPWPGVRQATSFAPHCPQPLSAFGAASTSEDCLYLNVFAPRGGGDRNLPVMVWLHGGSLLVGESDDYDPTALVDHGVIVVTINYRIGALGFLADAALAGHPGALSGNYGLEDQQAAVRWVQRNIRGFGGNPRNVTLFGEPAGGLSVLAQLVSCAARGLFERAIIESGLQPDPAAAGHRRNRGSGVRRQGRLRQRHRRLPAEPARKWRRITQPSTNARSGLRRAEGPAGLSTRRWPESISTEGTS